MHAGRVRDCGGARPLALAEPAAGVGRAPHEPLAGERDASQPWTASKRWPWMVIRLLLSVGFVVIVLRSAGVKDVGLLLARSLERWPGLVLAALLPGFSLFLAGQRLRILLAAHSVRPSLRTLVAAQLVGTFFNLMMPSTISGDLARSWWISKPVRSMATSVAVVGLDRILSIAGASGLALGAIWLVPPGAGQAGAMIQALLATVIALSAAVVLLGPSAGGAWQRRTISRLRLGRIYRMLGRLRAALLVNRAHPRRLVWACALSLAIHVVIVVQYVILATSLGPGVSAWRLAAVIPLVTVVTMIPVTINGIGLREMSLAALGAAAGLDGADAIAVSWYVVAISVGYGLLGGLIYLRGRDAHDLPLRAEGSAGTAGHDVGRGRSAS